MSSRSTTSFTGGDGAVQPAGRRFQISSTASAEAGIDFIGIRLHNNADGSGTGENGQLTSEARIFMIPGTSGAAGENWTYTFPPLPRGTYEVTLLAQDEIGGVFYNGGTITAQ